MTQKKRLDGAFAGKAGFFALALAAVAAPVSPALAGFEWTPPPGAAMSANRASMPPVSPAPAGTVEKESLDGQMPLDPFPMEGDTAAGSSYSAPVMPLDSRYTPPAASIVPPASPIYSPVEGFGSDIALALALRQIVPPGYSYSFDPGISPGMLVSWSGGAPWNEVLIQMLATQGLSAVIGDSNVWIRDERAAPMAPAALEIAPSPAMAAVMPLAPLGTTPAVTPAPVPVQTASMPQAVFGAAENPAPAVPQSYPHRQKPMLNDAQSMMAQGGMAPMAAAPVVPAAAAPFMAPPAPQAPPSTSAPVPLALTPAAISPAAAVTVLDPADIKYWQAEQGESLRAVLGRWSSLSGVTLIWNSTYDYMLGAPVRMHGTYPDAVTQVLNGYGAMDPRPVGQLHPNLPAGPSVLVVTNFTAATH